MSRTKFHLLVASVAVVAGLVVTGTVVKTAAADQPQNAKRRPFNRRPAHCGRAERAESRRRRPEEGGAKLEPREGKLKAVDVPGNKLVLTTEEDKFDLPVDLTARRPSPSADGRRKLTDLKEGMEATVSFRDSEKAAVRVDAGWPKLDADVKSVDAAKGQTDHQTEGKNGFDFDYTFTVAADVEVEIDGIPAGLADIKSGGSVELEFAADKKTVVRIEADGEKDELTADVKAVDAATSRSR